MKIVFINNQGAGFADQIEIPAGMTIQQLFEERIAHGRPEDYLIRVNRQPTTSDYQLMEGDRVSITPTKIKGACLPKFTKGPAWEPEPGSTVFL